MHKPNGQPMRDPVANNPIRGFIQDERGATAIEYAMIASGISIAIVSGVSLLGGKIMTAFYDQLANLF